MSTSSLRVYGGVEGGDRAAERRAQLLEAGLDLLGAPGAAAALTVRGVCKRAGLAARYFYESFADRDALAVAVFDHVVDDLASTTLAAVRAAPPEGRAKIRAGIDTIVRTVADDPRRAHLLFSASLDSALLGRRRLESSGLFAALLGGQAKDFYGLEDSPGLETASEFVVGGLGQALTAWLGGSLPVGQDRLVEQCTDLLLAIGERDQAERR